MIQIEFTKHETEMIERWYENMRERSGHFGNGAATFPDDDIILNKLKGSGPYDFTEHHLGVIVIWAEGTIRGSAITPAEYSLLEKILDKLGRSIRELDIVKP